MGRASAELVLCLRFERRVHGRARTARELREYLVESSNYIYGEPSSFHQALIAQLGERQTEAHTQSSEGPAFDSRSKHLFLPSLGVV